MGRDHVLSSAVPTPDESSPNGALREVFLVYGAVTAVTVGATQLPRVLPGFAGYEHLFVGAAFLLTAVKRAQREPGGMRRFGVDLAGLLTPPDPDDERRPGPLGLYDLARAIRAAFPAGLRETGVALGLATLIFPPFVIGYQLYHQPTHAFVFNWPDEIVAFALTQLVVVALPEEAFFRGYVQTRLTDLWPTERSWLGAKLGLRPLLLQAALFALIHFASIPHPARLAVFFPALLFGWVRAWRGGIGAAMLLHALSNVLAHVLEEGWG